MKLYNFYTQINLNVGFSKIFCSISNFKYITPTYDKGYLSLSSYPSKKGFSKNIIITKFIEKSFLDSFQKNGIFYFQTK